MTALQEKILSLLKDFDKLCRSIGVEYYLVGGSLIGALRHKGFIPWDDDADVIMTRDNWKKFAEKTKGQIYPDIFIDYQYMNDDKTAVIDHTINHYTDTSTTQIFRYTLTRKHQSGVLIDVLILDPLPDDPQVKELYRQQITEYADLVVKPYFYSIRTGKENNYLKNIRDIKLHGQRAVLDKIGDKIFNFKEEESSIYVQRFAGSAHFWPKEVIGKPHYVPFEDTMMPVPEHPEECLCIGYDDDWYYVPSGGVTKSQHDFCVCDLNVPGEIIGNDYSGYIDYNEVSDVYLKWKKNQAKNSMYKFNNTLNSYMFAAEAVRLVYKKKGANVDLYSMVREKNYEALDEYFEDYIKIQCTHVYLGSSALQGWISWYRKCHPYLIDIGDDALYAVLFLFEHNQRLAWMGKLLKAREAIDRPLTEQLQKMKTLYSAIKQITYNYDGKEYKKCREMVDKYLPEYPDDPFLLKFDLKLRIKDGIIGNYIIKRADELLELFPEDAELMYFKADELLKKGETEEGISIFRSIAEFSNHGIVLLNMKESVAAMLENEPQNTELAELWLKIRERMGEEDLPDIDDLIVQTEDEEDESEQSESDSIENDLINSYSGDKDVMNNLDDADNSADDSNSTKSNDQISDPVSSARFLIKAEERPLTDIQKKRLQLLCELRDICKANSIRYYLWGKGLLQASRKRTYIDEEGDLVVVMTPANCQKFMNAVKEENRPDRFLDSMRDNPKFHRFCVRYGDTESLDFFPSQCANPNSGIYVTVEILRNAATAKHKNFRNKFDQMLEAGWETRNTMKWTSAKRKISYFVVCVMCFFFGEKKVGRMLFDRFLNGPGHKVKGKYYLKPFWGKRMFYPSFWFTNVRGVKLEGEVFTTMKPCDLYLKKVYGPKWKTRAFPYTKDDKFKRVVDASIPCAEYLKFLGSHNIDVEEVFQQRQLTNKKFAYVSTIGAKTSHYWDIMCMCGERYRLYQEYMPKKLYLQELFRSNKIKLLLKELDDFYKTALTYSKKGLGLCFDMKISNMLDYCLKVTGKGKQAAALRRLLTAKDKEPIVLENFVEGNGLREATEQEIPAILTYLKRNLADCLYMYIDIAKYGLENPNMKIWINSDQNGVRFVMMMYYSGISVQADENAYDPEEIARIVKEEKATVVRGKKSIVEKIEPLLSEFTAEYGYVFEFTNYRYDDFDGKVETAVSGDTLEIAKLIRTNEELGSYFDVDGLAKQLSERIETGMGRSLIIRENDKIVAHIATYAEFEKLAVTSALIVAPSSQNGIYGSILEGDLVRQLWDEGFKVYTFIIKRLRKRLLETMGNKCVGEFGRLYINTGNE